MLASPCGKHCGILMKEAEPRMVQRPAKILEKATRASICAIGHIHLKATSQANQRTKSPEFDASDKKKSAIHSGMDSTLSHRIATIQTVGNRHAARERQASTGHTGCAFALNTTENAPHDAAVTLVWATQVATSQEDAEKQEVQEDQTDENGAAGLSIIALPFVSAVTH